MKELTNNQQEAVKLFNNHVELGDFWDEAETPTEATDYIRIWYLLQWWYSTKRNIVCCLLAKSRGGINDNNIPRYRIYE